MKNHTFSVAILLVFILTLVLCACGENSAEQHTAPAVAVQETAEGLPKETDSEEPPTVNKRELAETMVGKSMSELMDLIGEPSMSDYAPSCLGPGEDGEHHYDGFIVYTYREDGEERVEEIYVVK